MNATNKARGKAVGETREQTPEQSAAVWEAQRKPKDTPHGGGTGSHSGYEQMTTQATYATYLTEDTKRTEKIPTRDAFDMILNLPDLDWAEGSALGVRFQEIVGGEKFQLKLAAYCEETGHEIRRYTRFVELSNYVFQKLEEMEREDSPDPKTSSRTTYPAESLCFCRNDPTFMVGSDASRKPDALGLKFASILQRHLKGTKLAETAFSNPSSANAFHWLEVLLFIEFKRRMLFKPQKDNTGDKGKRGGTRLCRTEPIPAKRTRAKQTPVLPSNENGTSSADDNPDEETREDTSFLTLPGTFSGIKQPGFRSEVNHPSKRQKTEDGVAIEDDYASNPDLQCASYALELLSHGGLCTHAIGLLILEDQITLKYYDHSIVIDAHSFSFKEEPMRFVAILYAMSRMTFEQWGFDPVLGDPMQLSQSKAKPSMRTDNYRRSATFKGTEMRWTDEMTLTLEEEIFNQYSIIGRGTRVVSVSVKCQDNRKGKQPETGRIAKSRKSGSTSKSKLADEHDHDRVAVKFGYVPTSRKSEVDIVKGLRDLATKSPEDEGILDHLPLILDSQDHPTRRVQQRLKGYFNDCDECQGITLFSTYEERVLRITVQEILKSIKPLRDGKPESELLLTKIFHDIFKCYRWVHEKGKILHRDISVNNLMYRQEGEKVSGVLIDYNLAVATDRDPEDGPTSKQRTGTKPFMARDLLDSDPAFHTFRHDLESYFYCLLWMIVPDQTYSLRKSGGGTITLHVLYKWEVLDAVQVNRAKWTLLGTLMEKGKFPKTFPDFQVLREVAIFLGKALGDQKLSPDPVQVEPKGRKFAVLVPQYEEQPKTILSFPDFEFVLLQPKRGLAAYAADINNAPYDKRLASLFRAI